MCKIVHVRKLLDVHSFRGGVGGGGGVFLPSNLYNYRNPRDLAV